MYRLWAAIQKEALLLFKDIGGLLTIFLMPLVLVVTITMIQNSTMDKDHQRIPLLFVDNDQDDISKNVQKAFSEQKTFEIVTAINNETLTEAKAKALVFDGSYQLAIVLPKDLSKTLNKNVQRNVASITSGISMLGGSVKPIESQPINLYFDPATEQSFKDNVKNAINNMVASIETEAIYKTFEERLGVPAEKMKGNKDLIRFEEILPKKEGAEYQMPTAVQHNVPAWLLFAIFFINMPIALNLVKEKNHGISVRLRSSPMPYWLNLLGKVLTYLMIVIAQFIMMILVSQYVFPQIGLPKLDIEGRLAMLTLVSICAGLAAIGLGVMIGTVMKTQEQASPFSALSVVILAAIGGIWVPVFIMPPTLQKIAMISPLNWGINAYYDVLLRNLGIGAILPEIGSLLLFFIVTLGIAVIYEKKKSTV